MGSWSGSEADWAEAWSVAEGALASLMRAGWLLWDNDTWQENDETEPALGGVLRRACTGLTFEFDPRAGVLTFLADPVDDSEFDVLDEEVTFDAGGKQLTAQVEEWAGRCGLLDPTRVEVVDEDPDAGRELMQRLMLEQMLEPSALHRGCTVAEAAAAWDADRDLSNMISWFGIAGADRVLPEAVPSAIALGIAGFCWRNNTAVEGEHHRLSNPEMAKTSIAAVRAVRRVLAEESIDDDPDAIDWTAVEDALCDPDRRLGDGRALADLFAESWPEVIESVREQVRRWRQWDEEILGPQVTQVVLTLAGSTSYTRQWWGQGRWPAIAGTVVDGLVGAGLALPAPYDALGRERLVRDLADIPDLVDDEVLRWFIDPPERPGGGADGLRFTSAVQPPVHRVELEPIE